MRPRKALDNNIVKSMEEALIASQAENERLKVELEGYKEAQADKNRLVRELDVLINGEEGAAKQASLCDIVSQVRAALQKAEGEQGRWIDILRENQQAQIAGYYNIDKTDEERKIRNAVIEEYRDLILIFKSRQFKQTTDHDKETMG